MHRDRAEVEEEPAANKSAQRRICDRWRQTFNHVRPHDALGGRVPADVYKRSSRKYARAARPNYLPSMIRRRVDVSGHISYRGDCFFIGRAFARMTIALQPLDEIKWRVWFYDLDIGEIEITPMEAIENTSFRTERRPVAA